MKIAQRTRGGALLLLAVALSLSACAASDSPPESAVPRSDDPAARDLSAPTTETVQLLDHVQEAFTVEVPAGWDSVAYTTGELGSFRYTASSVSPDGQTVLFIGDPGLPHYYHPDYAHPTLVQFAEQLAHIDISPYVPAAQYYGDYVAMTFGELPNFQLVSQEDLPGTVDSVRQQWLDLGLEPPQVEAVETRYSYTADGTEMNALLVGVSVNSGAFWSVDVSGMTTDRDLDEYRPMLVAMTQSLTILPEWDQKLQMAHEQQMAQIEEFGRQLTAQHNANMEWIQASAQAHQSRMEAIWATGDASMQAYYDRMDSMDVTQQSFLNYINDESTVQNSQGQQSQVQSGYSQYYQSPTGTYVGTNGPLTDQQLYELVSGMGLDPNGWEPVSVIR